MKTLKYTFFTCLVVFFAEPIFCQSVTNLDGRSFTVSLIPSGKNQDASWTTDTFIFNAGELYSKVMKKREGFKRAAYSPVNIGTEDNPVIKFTYEAKNLYGSLLKIEGVANLNTLEGTASWTDDQGEHIYTFSGTLLSIAS